MAASVLNTPRAIDVSVYVIRAFVKLREFLATHKELAQKLAALEQKVSSHDGAIQSLVAAIRRLASPSRHPRGGSGFMSARRTNHEPNAATGSHPTPPARTPGLNVPCPSSLAPRPSPLP